MSRKCVHGYILENIVRTDKAIHRQLWSKESSGVALSHLVTPACKLRLLLFLKHLVFSPPPFLWVSGWAQSTNSLPMWSFWDILKLPTGRTIGHPLGSQRGSLWMTRQCYHRETRAVNSGRKWRQIQLEPHPLPSLSIQRQAISHRQENRPCTSSCRHLSHPSLLWTVRLFLSVPQSLFWSICYHSACLALKYSSGALSVEAQTWLAVSGPPES